MWIVTNNSYLSVVEDKNNKNNFVVRARIAGDLQNFFTDQEIKIYETDDSDYRFRTFVSKIDFVVYLE
jgi:hypothetical protein